MAKLTIKDLFDAKKAGRQLTQVLALDADEASACEAAGIDMLITGPGQMLDTCRAAAPNTFLSGGILYGDVASETEAIRAGLNMITKQGADAIYAYVALDWVHAMNANGIPVVGHVGLIPHTCSRTGGFKAVGKTADQALQVYRDTLAWQEAGAIGVEFEVVPHKIAAEVAKRVDILVISMGSGHGDVQYLFGCDILGTSPGHVPRHAKQFVDLKPELERIQQMRVDAFKAFKADVATEAFPTPAQVVDITDEEFDKFMTQVDKI